MARGQTLTVSSSEAARPAQHIAMSMCEPLASHSRVGANQSRTPGPNDCATASRYRVRGQDAGGPHEAADLKQERNESGAVNQTQRAQHDPARYQPVRRALLRAEQGHNFRHAPI